jgi:hypothetical protein
MFPILITKGKNMKVNSKFIIEHVTPVFNTTIGLVVGFFMGAKQYACFADWQIYLLFSPLFAIAFFAIYFEFAELKRRSTKEL